MSEHICPSCGEPVDLDNYYMKQVGTVTRTTASGRTVELPVYRMAHYTCPAVHIAPRAAPKPRKTAAEIAQEFDELCESYTKVEAPAGER
jgi:recombinational DNA repair protein (RecF pathway)